MASIMQSTHDDTDRIVRILLNHSNKWINSLTTSVPMTSSSLCVHNDGDIVEKMKEILQLTDDNWSLEGIHEKCSTHFELLLAIYNEMYKRGMLESHPEYLQRLNKTLEIIHYARNMLSSICHVKECVKDEYESSKSADISLMRFESLDYEKMSPVQKVLMYLFDKFCEYGYRRYQNYCYETIRTSDGYNTHAWRLVDTIESMIYRLTSRSENLSMFLYITKSGGGNIVRYLSEHLEKCNEKQFPPLIKDRHIFSFRNGIYLADRDCFLQYGDPRIVNQMTACKYFDQTFDHVDETDPDNISTPYLDKIYQHQRLSRDVIKWNKIYLGRLLYDVGEKDNWQTIMFLLGQGGTGKSTINNDVAKQFYDDSDVAVISNNIQRKFGLADICDKLLYIAPEIKYDWCIEQAEFQEMVSGGILNINIKFKDSKVIHWKTPGILGGNEIPNFVDNSGSIKRRIVVTRFDEKVYRGDTMLGYKLHEEIPSILKQCNMYYLRAVQEVGTSNIWDFLPDYFVDNQSQMSESTNSLMNFLSSGKLQFGEDLYCPSKVFITEYNNHCTENNLSKNKFVIDFYGGPFSQYDIDIQTNQRYIYPRSDIYKRYVTGKFFIGVDLKE